MAYHTSWKGYLKLSLVSVPVKAYSALSLQEGEIHFHQLHETCHSRIKYIKTCPLHGPVSTAEIVSGYEYAKGQYVVMDEGELDSLRSDKEKAVNVEAIVPDAAVDRLYLSDRISYLVPDGRVGEKPYAVIEQCLEEQRSVAIGRFVMNGKDQVVLIRPLEGLLVMTVLSTAAQVRNPNEFSGERPSVAVTAAEIKMTKTLFEAFYQDEIDLAEFKDHYNKRIADLIKAKVDGREVVTPAPSEVPDVINLMDALKKSVAQSKIDSGRKSSKGSQKLEAKPETRTEAKRNLIKVAMAGRKNAAKKKSKTA